AIVRTAWLAMFVLSATTAAAQAPEEAAVRQARDAYNAAIARRDLVAMEAVLAPAYHLVAGRSAQSHGPAAMNERWRSAFAGDSLYGCVRTPTIVRVHTAWGLAHEQGTWRCRYDGVPKGAKPGQATGTFDAKWQRDLAGRWRLQAEVFTTLVCEGGSSACLPPDSIPAVAGRPAKGPGNSAREVRAARTAYNAAIVAGDARRIATMLAPTYHAVFGRGAHVEGDSAARADWEQEFRDNGRGSCERIPGEVVVNDAWRIAHERGIWNCRSRRGAQPIRQRGVYVAKWQRDTGDIWRVQVEVFTTMRCDAGAVTCAPPEPIPPG
ncbi:MAG: DUF4440 domain-containing protein, partial [Gemmatimonadaceae bacterium]|nr:DUF4440 domain-containing protein [Gemmatimonadaceae bacterium]